MSVRDHRDVIRNLRDDQLKRIADQLAGDFLQYPQVCTPEFFQMLDEALRERGLMMSLEQKGIMGTVVSIVEM